MTLDAAIATHPQLWAAMTDAYRAAGESSFNDGVAYGMARSLAIVGKFSTDDVIERLCEETA